MIIGLVAFLVAIVLYLFNKVTENKENDMEDPFESAFDLELNVGIIVLVLVGAFFIVKDFLN